MKNRDTLYPSVYAKASKISHTRGKYVTCCGLSLYPSVYAKASKISHTRGKYVTCCGLSILLQQLIAKLRIIGRKWHKIKIAVILQNIHVHFSITPQILYIKNKECAPS
jgi:hypothetical protein